VVLSQGYQVLLSLAPQLRRDELRRQRIGCIEDHGCLIDGHRARHQSCGRRLMSTVVQTLGQSHLTVRGGLGHPGRVGPPTRGVGESERIADLMPVRFSQHLQLNPCQLVHRRCQLRQGVDQIARSHRPDRSSGVFNE
jgi:hypothetical protein